MLSEAGNTFPQRHTWFHPVISFTILAESPDLESVYFVFLNKMITNTLRMYHQQKDE